MAKKCIICKKELPDGSRLPVCEYHKGVAADAAANAGKVVVGTAVIAIVTAKDKVVPIITKNVIPAAKDALKNIKH